MKIKIKSLSGNEFSLQVESSDLIQNVKQKIEQVYEVPSNYQRLIFSRLILEDSRLLSDYRIEEESTVYLEYKYFPPDLKRTCFKIYVYTFSGSTVKLDVNNGDTIKMIKEKIKLKLNVPIRKQSLILFKDILLSNKKTLADYNIMKESAIYLCVCTTGGAPPGDGGSIAIHVHLSNGKSLTLDMESFPVPVSEIKRKVLNLENISPCKQIIIHNGKTISDNDELEYNSEIGLIITPYSDFFVEILTQNKESFKIKTSYCDSIQIIKKKIEMVSGYPLNIQLLYLEDEELSNSSYVLESKIFENVTLSLMIQPLWLEKFEFTSNQYPISRSKPRGVCLLINNEKFSPDSNLLNRNGSSLDGDAMNKTFSDLDYRIIQYDNVTQAEFRKAILKVAIMDHSHFDSIVICFMSHGANNDVIYDVNGAPIQFMNEIKPLHTSFTLASKPKLLFLQTCREETDDSLESLFERQTTLSPERDFLIAYATLPHGLSYRRREFGSYFLQTLCQDLNDGGSNDDILHVLTRVNDLVDDRVHVEAGYNQVTQTVSQLRKIFKFSLPL